MSKKQIGKHAQKVGLTPSIILVDPKYPHNVGTIVRTASCYGFKQVWYTGNRVPMEGHKGYRLPREERMKGYQDVDLINFDYPFDQLPDDAVPVALEVRENSEPLTFFEHPEKAVYVFGPEDGSLDRAIMKHCHRFVSIPTRHCLNLAAAVNVVLYDRFLKGQLFGDEKALTLHDT